MFLWNEKGNQHISGDLEILIFSSEMSLGNLPEILIQKCSDCNLVATPHPYHHYTIPYDSGTHRGLASQGHEI